MDRELGTEAKCRHTRRHSCWTVFGVLTFVLALLALILSTYVFVSDVLHRDGLPRSKNAIGRRDEGRLLREVADRLHKHHQQKRYISPCTSNYDPCIAPSAHITSGIDRDVPVQEASSSSGNRRYKQILSTGWWCENFYSIWGHVSSGMSYDKESGFLQVPVDGIYFVYSQVLMEAASPEEPVQYGHSTVSCACSGNCTCHTIATVDGQPVSAYRHGNEYLTSFTRGSGGTNYHGGLFNLSSNSYIAIVGHYEELDDIDHITLGSSEAFFGAYLISHGKRMQPTCNYTDFV